MNLTSLSNEVNLNCALERLCGDEALLIELLQTLVEEFNGEQDQLRLYAESQEFDALAAKAHYYKGIAANLDLTGFCNAAKALEQFARSADPALCNQAIEALLGCNQRLASLLSGLA